MSLAAKKRKPKEQVQSRDQVRSELLAVAAAVESVQGFFDQVGHETKYASSGNKHFFTKSCRQTCQNYEQSRQKLGTILENKVS